MPTPTSIYVFLALLASARPPQANKLENVFSKFQLPKIPNCQPTTKVKTVIQTSYVLNTDSTVLPTPTQAGFLRPTPYVYLEVGQDVVVGVEERGCDTKAFADRQVSGTCDESGWLVAAFLPVK